MNDEKKLTLEDWDRFFVAAKELTINAREIANALEREQSCDFEGFTEEGDVRYSYHDGCNCHGSTQYNSFPARLLFDEKAIEDIKAQHVKDEAEKKAKELRDAEAAKRKKEADERKEYERLSSKFGK